LFVLELLCPLIAWVKTLFVRRVILFFLNLFFVSGRTTYKVLNAIFRYLALYTLVCIINNGRKKQK
jgi:predicted ABC-type exoprotein transport system permease subunit